MPGILTPTSSRPGPGATAMKGSRVSSSRGPSAGRSGSASAPTGYRKVIRKKAAAPRKTY